MNEEKQDVIDVIDQQPQTAVVHSSGFDIMDRIDSMPVEKFEEILEKKARIQEKLRAVALKKTSGLNWANMGGKPHPTAAIISTMISYTGISLATIKTEKIESLDSRGRFYIYRVTVRAFHNFVGEITCIGAASSRDSFFAYKTINKGQPNEQRIWKDSVDIPEINVMKKAETNATYRCVAELLALKDLTFADIKKDAGINVQYNNKNKNGNQTPPSPPQNGEQKKPANQEKIQNMYETIMKECGGSEPLYNEVVRLISNDFVGFKGNYDVRNITSEKWYQAFVTNYQKKQLSEWVYEADGSIEVSSPSDDNEEPS